MPARFRSRSLLSALVLVVAACGSEATEQSSDLTQLGEGSREAKAVLAFANDRATTVQRLDVDAGLPSNAAKAIVAARDGADAESPADDNPFDTIAELDAVKYVGPATLELLYQYAAAHGYLEEDPPPPAEASPVDVIFSPQPVDQTHTARIAKLLGEAQTSIDVAMYSYSDSGIGAALQAAVQRGVKVRFLFDTASTDRSLTGSALANSKSGQLERNGVDVRWVNKIMHHKFVIIDGPRDEAARAATAQVATGSANWSNGAATRYDENTLFFKGNEELTLRLQREFNLLWDHSKDFVSGEPKPVDPSSLAIDDALLPDDPDADVYFTSSNFTVTGTTFKVTGANTVADELVRAIQGATRSIHLASGHLRSRAVAEALAAAKQAKPDLDVRLYLDNQEYIGAGAHADQVDELETCLAAAGSNESKQRACLDRGFLFGYQAQLDGLDVRYKTYAYRWDASYAKQMHHKYMVIDGETVFSGSYNLSDNAEHNTFENMFVFRGAKHRALADAFEQNFESMWVTGLAEDRLATLETKIASGESFPIVFDPMALTWDQITELKRDIRNACPDVDSQAYRENAAAHQVCQK